MILTMNCLVCLKTVSVGKIYSSKFMTKKKHEKIVVGNIYCVLNELSDNLQVFNEEFSETLKILKTMQSLVYIGGDFNIDLLKFNQKHHYDTFYENLETAGYLPRITLPTRITDHSATLLDNIFTNVLEDHTSGVKINSISDHQMIYIYKNVKIQHTKSCINRYIEIERIRKNTRFVEFN